MARLNPFRRRRARRCGIVPMGTPITRAERHYAVNRTRERDMRTLAFAVALLILSLCLPEIAQLLEKW